jgi:outer membrane protease
VRTVSGALLGGAKEIVLDSSGYKVSELDWPLLPVFTVGATVDLRTRSGLHAAVEFQAGIPAPSGTMTDSDYLNGDGVVTHYSQADNHSEQAIFLDAHVGWSLPLGNSAAQNWALEPFVSFQLIQLKWSAQNGYLQYPPQATSPFTPWSPSETKVPVTGTGILYQQDYYVPAIGLQIDMPILPRLLITASVAFAPYVFASDIDNHLFRLIDFYAPFMQGGLMVEPRVAVRFVLSPRTTLSLDASYRSIGSPVGDSYAVGAGAPGFAQSPDLGPGQQSAIMTNGESVSMNTVDVSLSLDIGL